jgi:hypothetical protein
MLILISLMKMHHVSSLPSPSIYPYLAALIGGDENACRGSLISSNLLMECLELAL